MIDIMKHKKEACIVNFLLISVALILDFVELIRPAKNVIRQIDMFLCMAALIPALIYIVSGCRKSAATFYKVFMLLFAASSLCALADDIVYSIIDNYGAFFSSIIRVLVLLGALFLAFVPNFGKKKSLGAAYAILGLELINAVVGVVMYGGFDVIVRGVSSVVLACIVCMFVLCKYADKDARGTI